MLYTTFTTVKDSFIIDTVASYDLRGRHCYRVVSDDTGTWLGTEYITVIGEYSVSIKVGLDFDENLAISFSVDGVCDIKPGNTKRKTIVRWLLAMWEEILTEYAQDVVVWPYDDDDQGSLRAAWYLKVGFVPLEDGSLVYRR